MSLGKRNIKIEKHRYGKLNCTCYEYESRIHLMSSVKNKLSGARTNRYFLQISYVSHIGGFVAGVLMGITVLRNFRKKRWERVMWWTAIVILTLLLAATIVLNIAPRIL